MVQISGGNDVFVDIGNKYYGVRACQKYLGGIDECQTLHVGDQFLSAGANDFKVRLLTFLESLYANMCYRLDLHAPQPGSPTLPRPYIFLMKFSTIYMTEPTADNRARYNFAYVLTCIS